MNPTLQSLPRRRGLLATCALAALLNLAGVPAACADSRLVQVDVCLLYTSDAADE